MEAQSPQAIAERLSRFVGTPRSILFAGAGIPARLNIPTWSRLLEELAGICVGFGDDLSASLIRSRVAEGDYIGAATVYTSCKKIPKGERLKRLSALLTPSLDDSALDKLRSLLCLGLRGVVTTNYDRVLHNAFSHAHR